MAGIILDRIGPDDASPRDVDFAYLLALVSQDLWAIRESLKGSE